MHKLQTLLKQVQNSSFKPCKKQETPMEIHSNILTIEEGKELQNFKMTNNPGRTYYLSFVLLKYFRHIEFSFPMKNDLCSSHRTVLCAKERKDFCVAYFFV